MIRTQIMQAEMSIFEIYSPENIANYWELPSYFVELNNFSSLKETWISNEAQIHSIIWLITHLIAASGWLAYIEQKRHVAMETIFCCWKMYIIR